MAILAKFEIESVQFLDKDGNATQPLPPFAKDTKQLIAMYRSMVLTRVLDTKAVNLQRMGKLGTYPSAFGQEAVGVGMAYGMHADDVLCPYYRDQAAMIQRGVKISEILAFWGGDERANNFAAPQVREDFPIPVPVGTQFPHAAGVATAFKIRHQKRAAVCGGGDGATSKGDFYEAINFAGLWHLPVVFVINNNQWAISVPFSKQSGSKTIAQKAIAGGFQGIQVDGNDVIAVRATVGDAVEKARRGEGPTLIEAVTYRLSDHTTADDATRYSEKTDWEKARQSEPISRLRRYLTQQKAWSDEEDSKLQQECIAIVDQAIAEYLSIKPQPLEAMFDYLYAKLPEPLQEQRAALLGDHHG